MTTQRKRSRYRTGPCAADAAEHLETTRPSPARLSHHPRGHPRRFSTASRGEHAPPHHDPRDDGVRSS